MRGAISEQGIACETLRRSEERTRSERGARRGGGENDERDENE